VNDALGEIPGESKKDYRSKEAGIVDDIKKQIGNQQPNEQESACDEPVPAEFRLAVRFS